MKYNLPLRCLIKSIASIHSILQALSNVALVDVSRQTDSFGNVTLAVTFLSNLGEVPLMTVVTPNPPQGVTVSEMQRGLWVGVSLFSTV